MNCIDCGQPKQPRNIKYIASFDGGGVRALFQVRLLQHIKKTFNVCLCQLFDMVVGTSMGGVVALTLAQNNKKSIDKYLEYFLDSDKMNRIADKSIFDRVFGIIQTEPIYDGKGKTKVFKQQFDENLFGDVNIPCVVTGYNLKECLPNYFCSWKEEDAKFPIVTLADITTAIPIYFPPIKVNDTWWIDGGIAISNPAVSAYVIGRKYFGPDTDIRIISMGTGIYQENWNEHNLAEWGPPRWIYHGLVDLLMSAPTQAVTTMMSELLGKNWLRLDSSDIKNVKLDDTREETIQLIIRDADNVFEKNKDAISKFFNQEN